MRAWPRTTTDIDQKETAKSEKLKRHLDEVHCPKCHQRVRVVHQGGARVLNFHHNSGTACPSSWQPVSP